MLADVGAGAHIRRLMCVLVFTTRGESPVTKRGNHEGNLQDSHFRIGKRVYVLEGSEGRIQGDEYALYVGAKDCQCVGKAGRKASATPFEKVLVLPGLLCRFMLMNKKLPI